jgi:putative peptide zinc metalloprotease protein
VLLGPYQGSGFRDERYLIRRADGQVVLVSELLYRVVEATDGERDSEAVAAAVTAATQRRLSTDNLTYLVEAKLQPLGVVAVGADTTPTVTRADPLLALAVRFVLVPERWVRRLAAVFAPLFLPFVPLLALVGLGVLDRWLFLDYGVGPVMAQIGAHPMQVLATFGLLVASMLFHECGHAAGCRYGGGRPGAIGAGLYLFIPAFYTNVTDAYRLDRRARLRTDLGGIYFNVVFILGLGAVFVTTGWAPLAFVIVLTHIEILQQLLPFVRLDGYYILSDLVGIPDLFARVRPVLRSVIRRQPGSAAVADLRPHVRVVVAAWVGVVVPVLAASSVLLLLHLPSMVEHSWEGVVAQIDAGRVSVADRDAVAIALGIVSIALVTLPLLGMALMAERVVRRGAGHLHGLLTGPRPSPHPAKETPMEAPATAAATTGWNAPPGALPAWGPPLPSSATIFTEEAMLRPRARAPERGWRHAVYALSAGVVNLGPSRAEAARRELIGRIKTPVAGSRRIVVLSRKGGAGKTTTTLMLGHTFAAHRGDRVVAIDANPDAGSLGHRVPRETTKTVTDLLAATTPLDRYSAVRAFTSQASSRLEVLASDDDPRITQRLGEEEYHRTVDILDRHYNLLVIDTGTGILDAAIQGVLMEADQLVVVLPPALDGARAAASTLDWLVQHGRASLVRSTVVAINAVPDSTLVELDRVEQHFASRCAAVVRIPWDPVLAAGVATLPEELRSPTQAAYLELAATVADQFRLPSARG